ncbi:MAG: rhodanese-like domain-containing protein [Chloroflexota bacterium]
MRGRPQVPGLHVLEAHRRLTEPDEAPPLLVDVREPDEFVRLRAAGAILFPLGTLPHRWRDLPGDRPILVICATGNRSASAAAFLLAAGVRAVANVEGGTVAWYRAGLPWRSGPPAPEELG